MKAVIYKEYGAPEVLQFVELEKPVPKSNEILINVKYTTVTAADWRIRSLEVPWGFGLIFRLVMGISGPKQQILGTELSGEVVEIGEDVKNFKVGDEVFAFPGVKMGSYVEYRAMPEDGMVVLKPKNLSLEESVALSFGGTTALFFLRAAQIKSGEKVLVNGASGCVGTAAIQIAKYFGADVTAVCSTKNIDLVKSIGADNVIDYTKEDFTKKEEMYDIIMDTAGTAPFAKSKLVLKKNGRLLIVLAGLSALIKAPFQSLFSDKKVIGSTSSEKLEALQFLAKLAEEGKFKPVIDKVYSFDQMIEAHRYVDAGHKRGNVVVRV